MATLPTLIEEIRVAAGDTQHPIDQLNGSLTSSGTTVTVDDGTKLLEGTRIAVELETMLVTDKPTVTTATVIRGVEGTNGATHADDLKVYIAPRFTPHEYMKAVNRALGAITIAFGKTNWDTSQSFTSGGRLIEVPTAALRVHDVFEKPSTVDQDITPIPFRFMPTAPIVASAKAIYLTGYNPGSGTAYIGYESAWPRLLGLTSSLDSLYPIDAEDLIVDGAVAYLLNHDLFERVAFDAAHARLSPNVASTDEIRLSGAFQLQRFLQRRFEVAARQRPINLTWIK